VFAGHRPHARALIASALAALTLGSCGTPTQPGLEPPQSFTAREQLPSCDPVDLSQGEVVPDAAWSCLDGASEEGAELVVTMPTTEGDPIVTYYRVGPKIQGVELFIDNSADAYAGIEDRGWSHQLCPETSTAHEPLGCRGAA